MFGRGLRRRQANGLFGFFINIQKKGEKIIFLSILMEQLILETMKSLCHLSLLPTRPSEEQKPGLHVWDKGRRCRGHLLPWVGFEGFMSVCIKERAEGSEKGFSDGSL